MDPITSDAFADLGRITPESDPNEAYEVIRRPDGPHGPRGWWWVLCNGIPVYTGPDEAEMRNLATSPAARIALDKPRAKKLWDR